MIKKIVIIFLSIIAILPIASFKVQATEIQAGGSAMLKSKIIEKDKREKALAYFLKKHNSPLANYAGEFVKAADIYGLDWKLVPAITGVESTFGKHIPYKSYNAYGWANGAYRFSSWEESIWHVNQVLKEKYADRGATTISQIGKIYAPPSPFWASKVSFFMDKIAFHQILAPTL